MHNHTYLIAIGGFAGVGKSTLARQLGRALRIPFYEIDLIGRAIGDSSDYVGQNPKGVAFDLFWTFARNQLENGVSLIFDQNMGRPEQWEKLKAVCLEVPGAKLIVFLLDCPFEQCAERFEKRLEHPDFGTAYLHDHKYKWDYLNNNEFPNAIRIDATRSQDKVLADVLSYLRPLFTSQTSS